MKPRLWHFRSTAIGFVLLLCLPVRTTVQAADAAVSNAPAPQFSEPFAGVTNGLGSWIWTSNVFDGQTCQFWHGFEIPDSSSVTNARLVMTADDEFTLYLDGRELGRGVDWRELFVFDLGQLLKPGKHALAVRAFNSSFFAGMMFHLQVRLTDGRDVEVKSDQSWRIVPNSARRWETRTRAADDWPEAVIKSPLGGGPWSAPPWPVNVVGMPTLQPLRLAFWQTGWFQVTLLAGFGVVILFSLRLMAQLAIHRKERRLLQQERTRIAREIHDDIGSRMTQLVLQGEVAQRESPDVAKMERRLAEICDESRGVLATLDEILWAVNPQRDTLRDFAAYVCNYAEEFLKPTRIQCLFEVGSEMPAVAFSLALRRSLLMAIKETLNNAVKYSEATELRLQIQWQNQRLNVVVQDNGKGFDPMTVRSDRHGMTNMRERMVELGGTCRVTSGPDKGCCVEFGIPLKRPRATLRDWIGQAKSFSAPPNESAGVQSNKLLPHHDPSQPHSDEDHKR